ncbi:hypothetical protein Acj9p219 [Acinetobacter phage Acj9]|uniref:Uncharacterized protein n=1 Tax=Acinetobacter phage Acj9 TaxID=760939 RepID=E5EQ03_9CAUD|nr:hypothetical protein Acj9p219 [Acinetobacter phage Acj9]ADG60119.1 hypothetical protein Acj9p219 [Acinetobacter phage Acj9]
MISAAEARKLSDTHWEAKNSNAVVNNSIDNVMRAINKAASQGNVSCTFAYGEIEDFIWVDATYGADNTSPPRVIEMRKRKNQFVAALEVLGYKLTFDQQSPPWTSSWTLKICWKDAND